ncbi:MAG: hypothetical protein F6K09_17930, partial [Merismopedia sp. SIO2A8]|nr:hypothetical protein [Merismopedia sp. SIO2A8]
MRLDLYKLDAIRNDKKAIAALENYVDQIIDEFLEAPEGQAYIQANPDEEDYVGEWFLKVLELAYKTEAITLPHLTPETLEKLLIQTLPPTLSAEETQDAKSLIPELMAFWSFLKRACGLTTASAILQTLKKIHPIFNRKLKLGKPARTSSATPLSSHYSTNGRGVPGSLPTTSDPLSILESLKIEVDDNVDIPEMEPDLDDDLGNDIDFDLDD